MSEREDAAHAACGALVDAMAALGLSPSIAEPEKLGGRATGRLRLVLRERDAKDLALVLRRFATTSALEA